MTDTQRLCSRLLGTFVCLAGGVTALGQTDATEIMPELGLEVWASSPAIVDLNADGYNDIVVVAVKDGHQWVYVFDGSTSYTTTLPGWPQDIGSVWYVNSSVAIGDINFDGSLDVAVGGLIGQRHIFALQYDGSGVPGWELVSTAFPPLLNATALGDANVDGAPDLIAVDESTCVHRFGPLARWWQCQFVADPVVSSPAVGDVGRGGIPGVQIADGIPDAICPGVGYWDDTTSGVDVFNTFGLDLDCGGDDDQLFEVGPDDWYFSSPALADLDGDGTQDIVISRAPDTIGADRLLVMASNFGGGEARTEFVLPEGSPVVNGWDGYSVEQFSSPALVDLDGGLAEIVIGSDGGKLFAVKYDPLAPIPSRLSAAPGWTSGNEDGIDLDGYAISSSPVAANLIVDTYPEIVVGTDGGRVYIVLPTGTPLPWYNCGAGPTWNADDAIVSTPAIGTRMAGSTPIIVAGNRHGLFLIDLTAFPTYDPGPMSNQWPTFHGNNARTGTNEDYLTVPTHGSVGGVISDCGAGVPVALLDEYYAPVLDLQDSRIDYICYTTSDYRFVFEMLEPGTYYVRVGGQDFEAEVIAGEMTFITVPHMPDDCNLNGVPDICDIADGVSVDCDLDGVPDECQEPLSVIYVDPTATLTPTGESWDHAYRELQDAFDEVEGQDLCRVDIWVAEGTYSPGGGAPTRNDSFVLVDNVRVYGGFPSGGSAFEARNPDAYPTILCGNIGDPGLITDNCYHIVTANTCNQGAIVDGFTIQNGYAVDGSDRRGAGLLCINSSPTISDCVFVDNRANYGGAIHAQSSTLTLVGCTFVENTAEWNGGALHLLSSCNLHMTDCQISDNAALRQGGGMRCDYGCLIDMANCTFSGNFAEGPRGAGFAGAVDCNYSGMIATNCAFIGNTSVTENGGALTFHESEYEVTLTNCTIIGNRSGHYGGAMAAWNIDVPFTITNCTIAANSADIGDSGTDTGGGLHLKYSDPVVTNCILWGNTADGELSQIVVGSGADPTVTYCDVQGGWPGIGNINADPAFVATGVWFDNGTPSDPLDDIWIDGDYRVSATSPCIDSAANPALPADWADLDTDLDLSELTPLDLELILRFTDRPGTPDSGQTTPEYPLPVDMGAYEYGLFADLDGDCAVGLADLGALLGSYGNPGMHAYDEGDLDLDGDVDLSDLGALLGVYGTVCP